jgi:glutamine synthetase
MAKWNRDVPGSRGHLHQSLWDLDRRKNLFDDPSQPHEMSILTRHYLGQQLQPMQDWMVLIAPTINSYIRMVQGDDEGLFRRSTTGRRLICCRN